MADRFNDLQEFLRQERELLGELLLAEIANGEPLHVPTQKSSQSPPAEELTLFGGTTQEKVPMTQEQWGSEQTLEGLNAAICDCVKCPLGQTRTRFVFGVGNPKATLMLIGEAPGADEDMQGEPFVGKAGMLLNKILEAIRFRREEVYICNILKCRPPGNRKPVAEEVDLCLPYLRKQISLIKPRVILALGLTAAENLLQTTESLGRLRGRVLNYDGIPLMVTYHPAALLRNPNWKRPTWEDVQALRKLHDELAPHT